MPHCIINICESGYKSCKEKFKFLYTPKDGNERKKWGLSINRKNFVLKYKQSICEKHFEKEVINEINNQISTQNTGRLFAIIHVCGKQFKVTESDIIVIQGYWPPTSGDKIKFEKVLLVGSKDFTLIGQPLLRSDLVSVDATVVEKTLSHTKTHFLMRKRKQYRRIHFTRYQHTIVRINAINLLRNINEKVSEDIEEEATVY